MERNNNPVIQENERLLQKDLNAGHQAGKKHGYRWRICALLFFATTLNYMDRHVLSLLAPDLQNEIAWSEIEYGYVVAAFQAAYGIGACGKTIGS